MKLKGKLILSCAALAAVATTAFSTTYAWYTSNTEVKATGISASTGTSNDSALQISLDGSTWGASVDLTTILASANTLTPVQRTAGNDGIPSKFTTQDIAGTTNPVKQKDNADAQDATRTANFVQFTLYFRNITIADEDTNGNPVTCPVYIKSASIVNANAGGVNTKLLTDLNSTYKQTSYSNYKVDLLRALDMEIAASYTAAITGENAKIECDSTTATTGEKTSLYNLESYACVNAAGTTVKDTLSDLNAGSWDALDYYNTVKGLTGATYKVATVADATEFGTKKASLYTNTTGTKVAADASFDSTATYYEVDTASTLATRPDGYAEPTTGLSTVVNKTTSMIGTIKSNKQILKTVWTLYLDGWDTACYDACKGQTIGAEFVFTTTVA